jgi:hypothetical protein
MTIDEIRQAKRLADHALSRVRLTADVRQKKLWQDIADEWLRRVATLEQRERMAKAEGGHRPENHPEKKKTSKRRPRRP